MECTNAEKATFMSRKKYLEINFALGGFGSLEGEIGLKKTWAIKLQFWVITSWMCNHKKVSVSGFYYLLMGFKVL